MDDIITQALFELGVEKDTLNEDIIDDVNLVANRVLNSFLNEEDWLFANKVKKIYAETKPDDCYYQYAFFLPDDFISQNGINFKTPFNVNDFSLEDDLSIDLENNMFYTNKVGNEGDAKFVWLSYTSNNITNFPHLVNSFLIYSVAESLCIKLTGNTELLGYINMKKVQAREDVNTYDIKLKTRNGIIPGGDNPQNYY
jgi:hypothetical protein